jgi:peroxiredoxin Q/BCP
MIEIGKAAPAFKLPNQDGKPVSLADHKGQYVVLYFYPKDDTPGCTVEACEFTAGVKAFEKLDAVVLGVSADSPESHRKFIKKHKLAVTLLSDADKTMMQQYGAYGEKTLYGRKFMGIIRSTVVIGPDGKVAAHWKKVKAAGHAEKVKEKLAELTEG